MDIPLKLEEIRSEVAAIKSELHTSNANSDVLIIISIIIATTAIISSIYYAKILTNQVKIQQKETIHRLRPILTRQRYENGETYQLLDDRIWLNFENKGTLPALNIIRTTSIQNIKKLEEDELWIKNDLLETKVSSLAPGEKTSMVVLTTPEQQTSIRTGKNCYFQLNLVYTDVDGSKYFYNMKGHFESKIFFLDNVDMN